MQQVRVRRNTAAGAATNDAVLPAGVMGYETDTNKLKVGDGVTSYNDLPYLTGDGGGGGAETLSELDDVSISTPAAGDILVYETVGDTFENVPGDELVPAASTSVAGKVELATSAETETGLDTDRATTPAGVAAAITARTASAIAAGIVELATNAETTTGTDTARATTPANVKAAIDARTASASAAGIVELATDGETTTGTDTARATTPANVKAAIDARVVAASASAAGIVELATDGETTTGTDTARATTPANVKAAIDARTASATAQGIVELATNAETTTGTDTARATTPANVKAAIDARTASATAAGIVELATDAETITGTDTARATTPANVLAAAVPRTQDYSATGAAAGFWMNLNLQYNGGGSDKEPWMISAKNSGGTLLRATWVNEAGALRTRSVNNEEALKMYGPGGGYAGVLIRLQDKWESTRTDIWAIDALGRPRIGPDSDICANVMVLTTGDTIPSGLPDGTVIVWEPA